MTRIHTILIANRGEIAVRIIRTARALGYRTVAVFSEADQGALHVTQADEAVLIGPAPVSESYLDMDRILKAARTTGADAVHPGYGFLSENAAFARACGDAGLTFIGPSPEAIEVMGNKAEAKRRMIAAGVPCIPGYEGRDQSDGALLAAAQSVGFPLMVKAAAGGGGRGMRLVDHPAALSDALALARSEALNAFGSGELILERAVIRPRHVEVQVFGDAHGTIVHMGERDCSVQRRHQKVIEEAPCPVMTDTLRARMGAAAVEAARSIGYQGAGTVEFLLDARGDFFFLEMNTRLQVEHPVTELITGLDLVALQIQVAQGQPLGLTQSDIRLEGHAIEARLYAEDPAQDFLPVTGPVTHWRPAQGEGVRIDTGISSGLEISPFYDPMIAKIMAHGPTREIATRRLIEALEQTALFGIRTNRSFLIDILTRPAFAGAEATTAFIGEEFTADDLATPQPALLDGAIAALLQHIREREAARRKSLGVAPGLLDWTSTGTLYSRYQYGSDDAGFDLTVTPLGADRYRMGAGPEILSLTLERIEQGRAVVAVDGRRHGVLFHHGAPGDLYLQRAGQAHVFRNLIGRAASGDEVQSTGRVVAPMHGKVLEVFVAPGDQVARGDRLAVLEAMKMQHEILAAVDGIVAAVYSEPGSQVAADDPLIDIEEQ